jgi:hypothetical protein
MSSPFYSEFNHPKSTGRRVQVMKIHCVNFFFHLLVHPLSIKQIISDMFRSLSVPPVARACTILTGKFIH